MTFITFKLITCQDAWVKMQHVCIDLVLKLENSGHVMTELTKVECHPTAPELTSKKVSSSDSALCAYSLDRCT